MNFIQIVNDLQKALHSTTYKDVLWEKVRDISCNIETTPADEEVYFAHLPVDLHNVLRACVDRLITLKNEDVQEIFSNLDPCYLNTLLYFIMDGKRYEPESLLNTAHIFILLNIIPAFSNNFFYVPLYLKTIDTLKIFYNADEMATKFLIVMTDMKLFLLKVNLPVEVLRPTIAFLQGYTYCCSTIFEDISIEAPIENIGYKAFVGLKILVDKLTRSKDKEKIFCPLLLSLMSSLQYSTTRDLDEATKLAHQGNVRLFIKLNFNHFVMENCCMVTNTLKFVCICSDYDDFEGIALLIQQLPPASYHNFMNLFASTMFVELPEYRYNILTMVLPILRHPPVHETTSKRLVRGEIILQNIIMMLNDSKQTISEYSLKIISDISEESLGRRVLRKIMAPENGGDVNAITIQDMLYRMIDITWTKKSVNLAYIQLMCNIMAVRKDLVTITALNRLRNICNHAIPHDLKTCIPNFKKLLELHSNEANLVLYILSIFERKIFHQSNNSIFAVELHKFIFSNITVYEDESFIWNVINYLLSWNFDVFAIFQKFDSLKLLQADSVRILMEYKIHETYSRMTALKLLCVMLHFVHYEECHCLDEQLEQEIVNNYVSMTPLELSLIVYAITRILEKKRENRLNEREEATCRQMHGLISTAFFDQLFPISTVSYVIVLLYIYTRLVNEDVHWDRAACLQYVEHLDAKLNEIENRTLLEAVYIERDVVYVSELILLRSLSLPDLTFIKLHTVVDVSAHTYEFSTYLKHNQRIWSLCLILYMKNCFVNSDLTDDCISILESTAQLSYIEEDMQLQIVLALYDFCSLRIMYYNPLIPFLFKALTAQNNYLRFVASQILIKLVDEDYLRFSPQQYSLFMGLLSDQMDIIAKNVEKFVLKTYVKKFYQTVARQCLPCIINYNFYKGHPTIGLEESELQLLRYRTYTFKERVNIYACLFRTLPEKIKMNVMGNIATELFGLVLDGKLPMCSDLLQLLEDGLCLILNAVPKEDISIVPDGTMYYVTANEFIKKEILEATGPVAKFPDNEHLSKLLTVLLRLLYSDHSFDAKLCQNLMFTITQLTKHYYTKIQEYLLSGDYEHLKKLYELLPGFIQSKQGTFRKCLLTISPHNYGTIMDREDIQFYAHEIQDFALIPLHSIIGINR